MTVGGAAPQMEKAPATGRELPGTMLPGWPEEVLDGRLEGQAGLFQD